MLYNLKRLRKAAGITQQQLAAAVDVSQQSINKYENHDIEPDIRTLIALADYFHTSVDYLIGHTYVTDHLQPDVKLSSEEIKVINLYRFLSPKEKESIHLILENYNEQTKRPG